MYFSQASMAAMWNHQQNQCSGSFHDLPCLFRNREFVVIVIFQFAVATPVA